MSQLPRYESYKDSGVQWLGEIPSHWAVVRLDQGCEIVRGNTGFSKADLLEEGQYVALQYGKTYKVDEEQLETLKSKNFNGKILIITEPWCGDASATVPAVSKFFEGHNDVRIFYRDSDTSLIDQFLTNGTQSIPKILILDENFEVKNVWGPRPQYGTELLKKFKENPETYPREDFYNDLQVYYAKNKGKDAIQEILELL